MPYEKRKAEGKWCVYKEGADKPLACHANEREADDHLAALHANVKYSAGHSLDAEIFAVGKWNGLSFTQNDLRMMEAAFNELGDNMRVPLKLGHNSDQPMTDGHPALGWVEKVWVAGDKLMARFVDMPKVLYDSIKKRLYRNVSVELDMDVQYKGADFPFVLTGVAVLGADIPAVNTLADLTTYMSRGAAFSVGRHAVFSAIAGQSQTKEYKMTLEELIQKVAELTTVVATFTTENATLKADKAQLESQVAKFTAEAKAKADADTKTAVEAKRTQVTTILEDGVKSEAITPAQRETYSRVLRVSDDAAVQALDIEQVKAMIPTGKQQFSREQGRNDGGAGEELTAPEKVAAECQAMITKGEAKTFQEAQTVLFKRDPKLAREYVNFNDKE